METDTTQERIAVLEQELDALRQQLAAALATRVRPPSLKRDLCCPQCEGKKVLHAGRIPDRSQSGTTDMSIGVRKKWYDYAIPLGNFEVFTCAGCGFSEWHVPKIAEVIDEIIASDEESFYRVIDGGSVPTDAGPYR